MAVYPEPVFDIVALYIRVDGSEELGPSIPEDERQGGNVLPFSLQLPGERKEDKEAADGREYGG